MVPTVLGPQFDRLFEANVVFNARAREYSVRGFPGPFSIKGVSIGEAMWRVGGQRFVVDSTSWLVVDRMSAYDLEIRSAEPVETFIVFFADALLADVATTRLAPIEQLLDDPGGRAAHELLITQRLWSGVSEFQRALACLREAARSSTAATQGMLDAELRICLDACSDLTARARDERERIRASRPATRRELYRRVLRGKAHLDEMLCGTFDLEQSAAAACLAPHHFHRTFRSAFGATPYGYVSGRRIDTARRLLAETDSTVAEVCDAVGYESLPSFTARFRQVVGVPPAEFRNEIRKQR
ncbi:MAG TPA: AraC family transcriptional regulator [Steroidobacteraceae bacterium]|jgi:AraC-like DNA-binding protein